MQLYKFCKSEHLTKFFEQGTLRIGTLHDYRNENSHGQYIGDSSEGVVKFGGTIASATAKTMSDMPLLQHFIQVGEGTSVTNITFDNCTISIGDLYVFSASIEYSPELQSLWRNDPIAQYDACYSIHSARLFYREISRAITRHADFVGFSDVTYYDQQVGVDLNGELSRLHPAQLKAGKNHATQREVRAFWQPTSQHIEPLVIDVPGAIKYCSAVK